MHFRWTSSVGNPLRSPGGGAKGWARCAAAGLGLALLPFMALTLVTEAPAGALRDDFVRLRQRRAHSDGTAGELPVQRPSPPDGCSLAEALTAAASGDTIDLATPGTTPYIGNWVILRRVLASVT